MIQINQVSEEIINNVEINLFISASGFESRAIFQAEKFRHNSKQKIAFCFKPEPNDIIRTNNDINFENYGFQMQFLDSEESAIKFINQILVDISAQLTKENHFTIYIDYSCMTKNWYSYLLYGIYNLLNPINIKVYLGYSHALFSPFDGNQSLNKIISPLFGYCDLSVPSKPTALVIGMGNEANRIYSLREYFDSVPYLFYSDTTYNEEHSIEVERQNKLIIEESQPSNIFKFPVHDLIYTHYILQNLCLTLAHNYRVILAPCGPKPFSILSMIIALNNSNNIEVWRISAGSKISRVERKPTGLISILELSYY